MSVSFVSAGRCSAVCPAVDGGEQGSERRTAGSRAAESREGDEQRAVGSKAIVCRQGYCDAIYRSKRKIYRELFCISLAYLYLCSGLIKDLDMCTYNLMLDDQLVAEAESTLTNTGIPFHLWLQQQVEELLREQVNHKRHRVHSRRRGLTDEQLAAQLAEYAPLTDADFPELSKSDYDNYIRSTSGRIAKGVEKWL